MLVLSVIDLEEGWSRRAWWKVAPGSGRAAIRERLMRMMWIETAHDAIGVAMFNVVQSSKHNRPA